MNRNRDQKLKHYDRIMLRSAFASIFWSVITYKKSRPGGFTLQKLAEKLGIDKSGVSRWFSKTPNWTLDTVSDIANALDVEFHIEVRDRNTGTVFQADGEMTIPTSTTKTDVPVAPPPSGQRTANTGYTNDNFVPLQPVVTVV